MPEVGGFFLEVEVQDSIPYQDFPRGGRVEAREADAASVHDGDAAAGDTLFSMDLPGYPIPGGVVDVVGAQLRGNLLHPGGVEDSATSHPQARGLYQFAAHDPLRALGAAEKPGAGEDGEVAFSRAAVHLVLRAPKAELQGRSGKEGAVNHLRRGLLLLGWKFGHAQSHGVLQVAREIADEVVPLHHAEEAQVIFTAPFAQFVAL